MDVRRKAALNASATATARALLPPNRGKSVLNDFCTPRRAIDAPNAQDDKGNSWGGMLQQLWHSQCVGEECETFLLLLITK